MATNPRNSQYGGASSPDRGTGLYTGRVTLIYDDGRVRVFIKTFGRNIGPCRIINKSAGDAISLNDEVLCTYANDTSDELIVIGRLTERVDPVSESTSGLVVEATTTAELVRITQKGTGAALLVEDSTNVDSTPFIIDASGNVGIGTLTPSTKLDITGAAIISGNLTVDTSTLVVDSTNNRVGIGTTSPASRLHIADDSGYGVQINSTTNQGLIGSNNESDALRISGGIPDTFTVGGNIYLYGNTHATRAADVSILTNGTEVLTIDSTGYVGIGTTSPAEKLDVDGNIALTGSIILEGSTANTFETTLSVTDPTADRTITFPNNSGTVALLGDTTYIGTTAVTLSRSSANLGLTGITSIAMPGSTSGTLTIQPSAISGTTTITFPATTGTAITTGNLSSITSTGTLTSLTLSGTITLPSSSSNQIYTSTTADSALPWSSGPVIQGATGWAFYSSAASGYRMGFRGSSNNAARYFWSADWALIGSTPSDVEVTNTLNVIGTGRFTGTVTAPTFSGALSGNASTATTATTATNVSGGTASGISLVSVTRNQSSSSHGNQGVQVLSSGEVAGLSFWLTSYGQAPVLRAYYFHGEGIDCGNNAGNGYVYLGASSFITRCSEQWKDDIRQKDDNEILNDTLAVLSIPVVKFNDKYGEPIVDGETLISIETNDLTEEQKQNPLQSNHINREGFIAETVAELFPKASTVDASGNPSGTDMGVITAQLLDAVKLLVLQGEDLSRRLSLLEGTL